MKILCPKCGKIYEVEGDLEGKKVECVCGRSFIATEIEFENKPKDVELTEEEKKKKQMQKGCLGCLVIIVIVFLFSAIFPNACSSPEPNKTPSIFSGWDGSCRPLVAHVEGRLRDPGSFEHIETMYKENFGETNVYWVRMRFRSKNGYGGYNDCSIVATVKSDGTIKEIIDYSER